MARFSVSDSVARTLDYWSPLFRALTFSDNFTGTTHVIEVAAGATAVISHQMRGVPTQFLVLDTEGMSDTLGRDPAQPWDTDHAFIKNFGSSVTFNGTVKILP